MIIGFGSALLVLVGATATGCASVSVGQPPAPQTQDPAPDDPAMSALRTALNGEYAAVYAYGVVGGRLTNRSEQEKAAADLEKHTTLRDRLRTELASLSIQPEPPAPAYALPFQARTPTQARALAANVETSLAPIWAALADHATGSTQQWAVTVSDACRARAASWSKPVPTRKSKQ